MSGGTKGMGVGPGPLVLLAGPVGVVTRPGTGGRMTVGVVPAGRDGRMVSEDERGVLASSTSTTASRYGVHAARTRWTAGLISKPGLKGGGHTQAGRHATASLAEVAAAVSAGDSCSCRGQQIGPVALPGHRQHLEWWVWQRRCRSTCRPQKSLACPACGCNRQQGGPLEPVVRSPHQGGAASGLLWYSQAGSCCLALLLTRGPPQQLAPCRPQPHPLSGCRIHHLLEGYPGVYKLLSTHMRR